MRVLCPTLVLALSCAPASGQTPSSTGSNGSVEAAAQRLESSLQRANALFGALQQQKARAEASQKTALQSLQEQVDAAKADTETARATLQREREAATERHAQQSTRVAQLERQLAEQQSASARALLAKQQVHAEDVRKLEGRIAALETERDEAAAREAKTRADAAKEKRSAAEAARAEQQMREAAEQRAAVAEKRLGEEAMRRERVEARAAELETQAKTAAASLAAERERGAALAVELAEVRQLRSTLQRALAELASAVAELRAEVERMERASKDGESAPPTDAPARRRPR